MATLLPYRFDVDYTGVNPNNYIGGEPHDIGVKKFRTIAPKYGSYFADSLQVFDALTLRRLERGMDYVCMDGVSLASAMAKKDICTTILIKNPSVSERITLDIQYLGGEFERPGSAMKLLLEQLLNDNRPVNYPDIQNRPTTLNPQPHYMHAGSLIGYESLVFSLERIQNAILMGDQIGHDELMAFITDALTQIEQGLNGTNLRLYRDALISSQSAALAAKASGDEIDRINAVVAELQNRINRAMMFIEGFVAKQAVSESAAKELFASYANLSAVSNLDGLINYPTGNPLIALNFPLGESVGLFKRDAFFIDSSGNCLNLARNLDKEKTSLANVAMELWKERNTGRACVKLIVSVPDRKAEDPALQYADVVRFKVHPFRFAVNAPMEVMSGVTEFAAIYAGDAGVIQAEYGAGLSMAIIHDASQFDTAKTIGDELFDTRKDFNVSGFGGDAWRGPVTFVVPVGAELRFTFKLSGSSIEQIKKMISCLMEVSFDVYRLEQGVAVKQSSVEGVVQGIGLAY